MSDEWTPILHYRDFYDVPHAIIAGGGDELLVLDAPFDDELDDYPVSFRLGTLRNGSIDMAGPWDQIMLATTFWGEVPVAEVEFDQTKRKALRFRTPSSVSQVDRSDSGAPNPAAPQRGPG